MCKIKDLKKKTLWDSKGNLLEELQNQNKQHTNFFIENISGRDESN